MDATVSRKLANAAAALSRFEEAVNGLDADPIRRDSAILRFTLALETTWKAARSVLIAGDGMERDFSGQPRAVVRECRVAGLIDDATATAILAILDDRNEVVHTYREAAARALAERLPGHAAVLRLWLDALNRQAAP